MCSFKDIVENSAQPTYVWCNDKVEEDEENGTLQLAGKDYTAFLLSETEVKTHNLRLHSLLSCEQITDFKEGTTVVIFGHPKPKEDWDSLELKLSAGKQVKLQSLLVEEEELTALNEVNHRVLYTNSTDTGNSGSPVAPVGKMMATTKYRVIAIHSGGRNSKQKDNIFNYGHNMAFVVRDMKEKMREAKKKPCPVAEEQEQEAEVAAAGCSGSRGRKGKGRRRKGKGKEKEERQRRDM